MAGKSLKLTLDVPAKVLHRLEAAAKRKRITVEAAAVELLSKVPNRVGNPGKRFFWSRFDSILDWFLLLHVERPTRKLSIAKDLSDLGKKHPVFKSRGGLLSRYNRIVRKFRKSGTASAEDFVAAEAGARVPIQDMRAILIELWEYWQQSQMPSDDGGQRQIVRSISEELSYLHRVAEMLERACGTGTPIPDRVKQAFQLVQRHMSRTPFRLHAPETREVFRAAEKLLNSNSD
jgi:hypothetical protein